MCRLVGFLLLVPLAVVLASPVQLSKLKCAYGDRKFCDRMKFVHRVNDMVVYLIKNEESFNDDKETISYANEAIRDVLAEGHKTQLPELLWIVVLLETSALEQLRVNCNGAKSERLGCKKGLEWLSDATCDLVTAVKELTGVTQLEAIQKVGTCPKGSSDPELAYKLGAALLDALENIEL
ncbi:unnamed protein product [Nippostrongylus brasiliensis]|uniref:Secreted protein n=1 Tax=Nippostrongylus brasiliensis TaxID=27835 RepID=A0A0N4YAA6_NIPBR|nr:unnamed protein product [Nippostrongylus brasiliensis]